MGSAIECFPGAQAILIPRTRFAPVKTTNDMLALASDAYEVTPTPNPNPNPHPHPHPHPYPNPHSNPNSSP